MRKLVVVGIASVVLLSGCASTGSNTQVLGGLGAITGAVVTKNPWKGAVIGGAIGAVGGSMIDERQARERQYYEQRQQQALPRTDCQKQRVVKKSNGRVISDTIEEVCDGRKSTYDYGNH